MAIIGDIRKHSGILVGVIAVSIFLFLISDATNSQTGIFRSQKDNIGEIDGKDISYKEFMAANEKVTKMVQDQQGPNSNITDEMRNQIREQVWNDFINDAIAKDIKSNTGLAVSDDEMVDLTVGKDLHPYILQNFGTAENVKAFIKNVDMDDRGQEPGTRRRMWNSFLDNIKKMQFNEKYNTLLKSGINAPTWMAEQAAKDQSTIASFDYVFFPYSDIADADLKITDKDLQSYLDNHAALFNQEEETRKVAYMEFNIVPSAADSANAFNYLNTLLPKFVEAKTKTEDSAYVRTNSETPFINDYFTKEQLAGSPAGAELMASPVGKVVGPYVDNGKFTYAKVSGRKLLSDSLLFRTITFSFNDAKDENAQRAKFMMIDSLYKGIDSGIIDFNAVVGMYGSDQEKQSGGAPRWIKFGEYNGEMAAVNSLLFYEAKLGKPVRFLSPSENAVKIAVLVAEKPSKDGIQVAYLTKSILPSQETENAIYTAAGKFAQEYNTGAKFKDAAKKYPIKYAEAVKQQDMGVQDIKDARELVRWIYEAKTGDISPIKTVDNKHVVAYLEAIREKGKPNLNAVKEQVQYFYSRDKKYAMTSEKIAAQKSATIADLAAKNNKQVAVMDSASNAMPLLGERRYEPAVIAAAIAAPTNKITPPVMGNEGTFVINKTSSFSNASAADLGVYIGQMKQRAQQLSGRAFDTMKKLIKIEDNRFDFF